MRLAAVLVPAVLCGCLGGQGAPPVTYFVLTDLGAPAPPTASPVVPRQLVVSSGADDAFYDAESLVYSRETGSRAYYQFAAWTDRPSRRVAVLVQRRLEARGRFASVSTITAGVNAELLLNVNVTELYHDVSVSPALARAQLIGEIVDWKTRTLVGRRSFSVAVPVARADARSAVEALNRGVTAILDELVPWAEATTATAVAGAR
jgi:cholesterol transport system auxiliary component